MSQRIITIGNQNILAEETELKQSDLLFYNKNPRIYTILQELGDNPPQEAIEKKMISLNHVKTLKESIKVNGGLLEPIIVRRGVVLEGNSRLAAYRILAKEDIAKWGYIKCNVLPDDTNDDVVTALLGTLHVIGKTPWSAFEQAGFLTRRMYTSRKPIDAIALELGLPKSRAQLYIKVFETMTEANDINPSKWSYYYELLKNKDIQKYDDNNPIINFTETIIDNIKNDKLNQAQDIRKFATLAKTQSENANEAITQVFSGDITLDEAVELVEEDTKLAAIISKVSAFSKYLAKEKNNIHSNINDENLRHYLRNVETIIKTVLPSK